MATALSALDLNMRARSHIELTRANKTQDVKAGIKQIDAHIEDPSSSRLI